MKKMLKATTAAALLATNGLCRCTHKRCEARRDLWFHTGRIEYLTGIMASSRRAPMKEVTDQRHAEWMGPRFTASRADTG